MSFLDRDILKNQGSGKEIPPLDFEEGSASEDLICHVITVMLDTCNQDMLRHERLGDETEESIRRALREDQTLRKFPDAIALQKEINRKQAELEEEQAQQAQREALECSPDGDAHDIEDNDQQAEFNQDARGDQETQSGGSFEMINPDENEIDYNDFEIRSEDDGVLAETQSQENYSSNDAAPCTQGTSEEPHQAESEEQTMEQFYEDYTLSETYEGNAQAPDLEIQNEKTSNVELLPHVSTLSEHVENIEALTKTVTPKSKGVSPKANALSQRVHAPHEQAESIDALATNREYSARTLKPLPVAEAFLDDQEREYKYYHEEQHSRRSSAQASAEQVWNHNRSAPSNLSDSRTPKSKAKVSPIPLHLPNPKHKSPTPQPAAQSPHEFKQTYQQNNLSPPKVSSVAEDVPSFVDTTSAFSRSTGNCLRKPGTQASMPPVRNDGERRSHQDVSQYNDGNLKRNHQQRSFNHDQQSSRGRYSKFFDDEDEDFLYRREKFFDRKPPPQEFARPSYQLSESSEHESSTSSHRPFNFDLEALRVKNKKLRKMKRELRHPMDFETKQSKSTTSGGNERNHSSTSPPGQPRRASSGSEPGNPENSTSKDPKDRKADDPDTEEIKRMQFNKEIEDLIEDILGYHEELNGKLSDEEKKQEIAKLKEKSRAVLHLTRSEKLDKVNLKRKTDDYGEYFRVACNFAKGFIEKNKPLGLRAAELGTVLKRREVEINKKLTQFAKENKIPLLDQISQTVAPIRTVVSILSDADIETKEKEEKEAKEKAKEPQNSSPQQPTTMKAEGQPPRTRQDSERLQRRQQREEERKAQQEASQKLNLMLLQQFESMNKRMDQQQMILTHLCTQASQIALQHPAIPASAPAVTAPTTSVDVRFQRISTDLVTNAPPPSPDNPIETQLPDIPKISLTVAHKISSDHDPSAAQSLVTLANTEELQINHEQAGTEVVLPMSEGPHEDIQSLIDPNQPLHKIREVAEEDEADNDSSDSIVFNASALFEPPSDDMMDFVMQELSTV